MEQGGDRECQVDNRDSARWRKGHDGDRIWVERQTDDGGYFWGELQADPGGAGGVVLVKVKWLLVGKNHTEVSGIRGQDDFCGRII